MINLQYKSTRGSTETVTAAAAIVRGIAADGGLFVPTVMPSPISDLTSLAGLDYPSLAQKIMQLFLPDFSGEELHQCITLAYDAKFTSRDIAPLSKWAGVYFLELFHGPTLAFKDMALTILPHLLKRAVGKLGLTREIVILTATSGDTGKAALEGFAGIEGTRIIVFFPEHGVSQIQKRQMITQEGDNTHVIGIQGNFDDAQNGVKAIFTDSLMLEKLTRANKVFSSANSINIGRLVPQVVYYFWAYLQLCVREEISYGEPVNFVVPSGNFGNILAGYYARELGLPLKTLVCASNDNKVLYDFFRTGVYDRRREFLTTISPSMDILVSSNLERLLHAATGGDGEKTKEMMIKLARQGVYEIDREAAGRLQMFAGGFATETATRKAIKEVFASSRYLMDTHTAVAYSVYQDYLEATGDTTPAVVVATASPFKFPRDVMASLDGRYAQVANEFALIREMSQLTGVPVPAPIRNLEAMPVRHRTVCRREEMQSVVEQILSL